LVFTRSNGSAFDGRLSRYSVEVVRDEQKFLDLEQPWNQLVEHCPNRHLFQRHEWIATWWRAFSAGKQLHILLVRRGSDLVGIAPFMISRSRFLKLWNVRSLEVIGNYEPSRDSLVIPQHTPEILDVIFRHLHSDPHWEITVLHCRPAENPAAEMLPDLCRRRNFKMLPLGINESPYLTLDKSWPEFVKSFGTKFRSNLQNRERRLSELGEVRHEFYERCDNLPELLERMFVVATKGWAHEENTGIGSTPELRAYYGSLAHLANQNGWLWFHMLSIAGKDVAFEYDLLFEGVVYNLKIGFDGELSKASPGKVLKRYVLQTAMERGATEYDMLGISDSFKREWTRTARKRYKWFIFNRSPYAQMLYEIQTGLWDPVKQGLAASKAAEIEPINEL
jgi:CelD/BcsL family acetyltransferase involved in cellulose biosynthesis